MNYKILITGISCASLILFGVYKLGEVKGSDQKVLNVFKSSHVALTPTPIPTPALTNSATPVSTVAPTPTPTPTPVPALHINEAWENIEKEANKKGITVRQAKQGELYNQKEVVYADTFVIAFEGERLSSNQLSSRQQKYEVILDLSIINNAENQCFISPYSAFVLEDKVSHYTYRPTFSNKSNGDLSGKINAGEFRRGELAFEVPEISKDFLLHFYIPDDFRSKFNELNFDANMTNYKAKRDSERTYYWNNEIGSWENSVRANTHKEQIDFGVSTQQPY